MWDESSLVNDARALESAVLKHFTKAMSRRRNLVTPMLDRQAAGGAIVAEAEAEEENASGIEAWRLKTTVWRLARAAKRGQPNPIQATKSAKAGLWLPVGV